MFSKCKECPFKRRAVNKIIAWEPEEYDIVIVNDFPTNSNKGLPFTYTQNKYLSAILRSAEIVKWNVAITNLTRCTVQSADKLNGKRKEALECCKENLEATIKPAKVIIGMGENVLTYFTGLHKINHRRGSIYKLKSGQYFIGALSFLSYIKGLRGENEEDNKNALPLEVTMVDFKRARLISLGELNPEFKENYVLYPRREDLVQLLDRLYSNNDPYVSVDIETMFDKRVKPHVKEAAPLIISFGFKDWGIVLDFNIHLKAIMTSLSSPMSKVFQGGIFDVTILNNCLIEVRNWKYDTLYLHHLILSELPHSMAFLQSVYTPMPYHKDMVEMGKIDEEREI